MKRYRRVNVKSRFRMGDKVLYSGNGRTYDFGYEVGRGRAVIYEEGEMNMQDSLSVGLEDLVKVSKRK